MPSMQEGMGRTRKSALQKLHEEGICKAEKA